MGSFTNYINKKNTTVNNSRESSFVSYHNRMEKAREEAEKRRQAEEQKKQKELPRAKEEQPQNQEKTNTTITENEAKIKKIQNNQTMSPSEQTKVKEEYNKLPAAKKIKMAQSTLSENDKVIKNNGNNLKSAEDLKAKIYEENNKNMILKAPYEVKNGYQFGDVTKIILGTTTDVVSGVAKGAINIGEGAGKLVAKGIGDIAGLFGNEKLKNRVDKNIKENPNPVSDLIQNEIQNPLEKYSVVGELGDEVLQGVGQTAGYWAVGTLAGSLGATAKVANFVRDASMFASATGSAIGSNMQKENATDLQVWLKSLGSGAIETATEKMFGFFGNKDTKLIEKFAGNFKTGLAQVLARNLGNAVGEGAEEFISWIGNNVLTFMMNSANKLTGEKGANFDYENAEELGKSVGTAMLSSLLTGGTIDANSIVNNKTTNNTYTDAINQYAEQQKLNAQEELQNKTTSNEENIMQNEQKMIQNENISQNVEENESNYKQKQLETNIVGNNIKTLEERVTNEDDLLNTKDFIAEIKDVGANIDENGYVTVYHQTTRENADKILQSGKMTANEDGIFFSTSKDAQQSEGRGDVKLELKIPAEKLQLDDIFDNNADVKIPLSNKNETIDVSKYLQYNNYDNLKMGEVKNILVKEILPLIDRMGYRSQEEISELKQSIKENGFNQNNPIELVKNDDGTISIENGNHRLLVANELGIKEVPIKFVESWSKIGLKENPNETISKNRMEAIYDTGYGNIERARRINAKNRNIERSSNSSGNQLENGTATETNDRIFNKKSYSNEQGNNIEVERNNQQINNQQNQDSKQESFSIAPMPKNNIEKNNLAPINDENMSNERVAKILTSPVENVTEKQRTSAILKANLIDKGAVFNELARKNNNRDLEGKWDYTLSAEARAQNAIGNSRYENNPNTKTQKKISESLETIKEKVGDNRDAFYSYMYHLLNIDRMTLNERYGIDNKPVFGDNVTAEESKRKVTAIEEEYPEFKKIAQDIYDYLNANKKELVDKGVISQELSDKLAEIYPHYVPIQRVNTKGLAIKVPLDANRTGVNSPLVKATGGSSDIQPLFETIAERTRQTYRAAARNNFGVELMNTLNQGNLTEQTNIDTILDDITTDNDELLKEGKNGELPTFTVFDNGEKKTFEITKDMYDALSKQKFTALNDKPISKIARGISNFRRGILTEYNPIFSITNSLKDAQDVLINSQHAAKTYAKIPESYSQIIKKGYWYNEYVQNGGEENSYFKNGKFESDSKQSKFDKIKLPLKVISNVNNVIEMAPRLAEYIASRETGRSIEISMLDAARVTTNFKAGGDFTKALNKNGATFLNASVQGFAQQARNIQEANAKGLKGYSVLALKFAIASSPAILGALLWKDDKDYEELQDYVKDNYYIIGKMGKTFLRIPKGRVAAVAQKIVSNITKYVSEDNKINIDNVSKDFWEDLKFAIDNVAPNNPFTNNIISPIIDVANNKTWYGEDLVPTRLSDKPSGEQYDETTDSISKWIGETLNLSPYKINYLIDQYSGGVGDVLLPYITKQAESGIDSKSGKLLAPLIDKFTTNATLKNKYPGEFYDSLDKYKVNSKSDKATTKEILQYKYMNSISSSMSDLYKEKRIIQNSNKKDSEKIKLIEKTQKEINELAKEALKEVENVKIYSDTANIGDIEYYKKSDGTWQKKPKKKDK